MLVCSRYGIVGLPSERCPVWLQRPEQDNVSGTKQMVITKYINSLSLDPASHLLKASLARLGFSGLRYYDLLARWVMNISS